jgi:acetyl esterase/lipase
MFMPQAAIGIGLVLLSAVAPARAGEPATFKVESTLDLPYVPKASDFQKLDVFRPQGQANRPVLLLVHGGSWMIGDKNFFGIYRDVAEGLAAQGLVVVSINYRLAPWVKHPEHVKDVARAFAWTRKHVKEYGGNPDSIFLCGHSAGGHLVTLVATDESLLRDKELALTDADRKAVRGVIAFSGVYNIPQEEELNKLMQGMIMGLGQPGKKDREMPSELAAIIRRAGSVLNPFRLVFGNDPRQYRQASPLSHVRPALPPMLLLYADHELPLLSQMAREFGDALKKAKNDVEVVCMEKRNHNSLFFWVGNPDDPAAKALLKFVARHR